MGSGNRLGRPLVMFGASASVVLDIHCNGVRPSPPARWRDAWNRPRAFKLCPHEPNDRILYYLPKRVLISEMRLLVWVEGPGLDAISLDAEADADAGYYG